MPVLYKKRGGKEMVITFTRVSAYGGAARHKQTTWRELAAWSIEDKEADGWIQFPFFPEKTHHILNVCSKMTRYLINNMQQFKGAIYRTGV